MAASIIAHMKLLIVLFIVVLLVACSTRLSAVSLRDEQAGLVLSAAGYKAHPADTDPDNLRYSSLYCKSREVLMQAGTAVADGGIPCR